MIANKILVVDDVPDNVKLLDFLLSDAGWDVATACSGEEALQAVRDESPDVILLDVMMPGMDGFEVCRRLKKDPALESIPVIMVTARANESDIVKGFDAGAQDYVTKPINETTILARVRSAVRSKQFTDRIEDQANIQKLESIGRLAAGIAHEINTPIQYVGDNVRFLGDSFGSLLALVDTYRGLVSSMDDAISDAIRDDLAAAEKDADLECLLVEVPDALSESKQGLSSVAEIVAAMKEFSHPGTKEKLPADINHLIKNSITVARNSWKNVATLETDFDEGLPMVNCLIGDLNQVILNLIVNAAHAIEEANVNSPGSMGLITIRTRRKDTQVEISISDTGVGISRELHKRIFEPFFTTKPVGKGTGQGLAITRSVVVEKHGGSIALESEEGKGATFSIRLPIC